MINRQGDQLLYRFRDYARDVALIPNASGEFEIWRILPQPIPDESAAGKSLDFLFAARSGAAINPQIWETHPEKLIELYSAETCLATGVKSMPSLPYVPLFERGGGNDWYFSWREETPPPAAELSMAVDARFRHYRQGIQENPGLNLFDGPIIRVTGVEQTTRGYHFRLCPGSYFALMISTAEIDRPFYEPIMWRGLSAASARDLTRVPAGPDTTTCRLAGPEETGLTHPMGVAALVFTEDDYLVFGLRSPRVSTFRDLLGPPVCGVVADVERFRHAQPKEFNNLLTEEIRREAVEELRLPDSSPIGRTRFLGAARELNRGGTFQFFYSMRLRIPFSELADRIQAASNPEYSCFYGLRIRMETGNQTRVYNDLIGRKHLDGRVMGNELRANLVYLRDNIQTGGQ